MCVCVCVYVRGHPCDTQFTKKRCGQRSPGFKMRAATAATGKRKGGKKNSVTLFIFSFKEQKTVLVFLISFFTFVSLLFVTVVTYRTLKKKLKQQRQKSTSGFLLEVVSGTVVVVRLTHKRKREKKISPYRDARKRRVPVFFLVFFFKDTLWQHNNAREFTCFSFFMCA